MKEFIDRLSLGITEYTRPVLEADVEELSIKLETGKKYTGSFRLTSSNGKALKGIIFSTDRRLTIENNQFIGVSRQIRYTVDTAYVNHGEEIKGFINIVSSGGELSIPYTVAVDAKGADTTAGSVKNMFHFANLVQMSYDEALNVFKQSSFPRIFLENNLELMAVYSGLSGSSDTDTSMEEFLVASNKKNSVSIALSGSGAEYADIEEDYGDTVIISKDTWGYVSIAVEICGDFIGTDIHRLTSADFAGNSYKLSYYIRRNRLHGGKNIGGLRFITQHGVIDYPITVTMHRAAHGDGREYKRAVASVLEKYIDFRLHRINLNQWADASYTEIARARNIKDSIILKLLHAQISITRGRDDDASWLLENVAEDLIPVREQEKELYCYYLYVRTIQKRDDRFIEDVIGQIREYYNSGCDSWKLLWMLMYLDDAYDNNISIKVLRIKEQYSRGMRSPLMYFEAAACFNEQPELLRVLDDFEIQVLNFGIKHDFIQKKLAMQVSDVFRTERSLKPVLLRVMSEIYHMYEEDEILWNICSVLIKCGGTDERYFEWFAKGVEKEMKITSLYEYYMYTIRDDFDGQIPQIIKMYFVYNHSALPDEKTDILFENIVLYKSVHPAIYDAYRMQLEKYAADNIMAGRMNRHLAAIYRDILDKAMVGQELAEKLPDIISTYEISCHDENMRYVIIVHKELLKAVKYPLLRGHACVKIYTEDAAVLFEDIDGRRYGPSVSYESKKLLDMEEYMKLCYEITGGSRELALYFADKYLRYRKDADKSIGVLKYMLSVEGLAEPFRIQVENEIIDYYSANYDGDSLDEYLNTASADSMGTPARTKLIEMTVIRGLYDRTYELVKKYGFTHVEPRRILKCVAKLLERGAYEDDELIVSMAAYAFTKGKYNETSLEYLSRYFNGNTKELLAIWKAARDFQCESRELEEKIIVQMLFSGAYVGKIDDIYASYYKKGANGKVKKAYLFSKSYDYFVHEKVVEESVFRYIGRDAGNGEDVNDMCALAYLKYMSGQDAGEQADICRKLIYELSRVNKVFEFFKKFKKYFALPYSMADKTMVEYRTSPENRVFIHYIPIDGNGVEEYTTAEMKDVCEGVFTYQFVLFYGENLQYYITEESGGDVTVTESSSLSISDVDFSNDSTHYGMLNDMLVCRDMREERTFEKMSKDYLEKRELLDTIFDIKK